MIAPRRTLFLHVGTRKSGTSYLQNSLRASVEPLRAQGLGTPFVDWRDHFRSLLIPVRDLEDPMAARGRAREVLKEAVRRVESTPEPRLLASFEDLAELDPVRISLLAEAFDDYDVQIIITARHWGTAMPSEWQQCIKERLTVTFPDYVREIRSGEGEDAERFLRRQDIPAMLERWGDAFGIENVHLIPLPAKVVDRGLLPRLFCGLVGVDPDTLVEPDMLINASLGYDSAETLRRVNIALGDRLPRFMSEYRVAVREVLRGPLMREKGASPAVPPSDREWCQESSASMVTAIKAIGCDVVGDLDDLLVQDWSFASGDGEPSDAAVARIATSALADLTVSAMRQRKPGSKQRPSKKEPAKKPEAPAQGSGAAASAERSLTKSLRSRIRQALLRRRSGPASGPLPESGYNYVFVVSYGRSGSTLVQGLVNALPRTLIRGENGFYIYPLYEAWSSARAFRDSHEVHGVWQPSSAFYGLAGVEGRSFTDLACEVATRQLLGSERATTVDTLGFKEVRWHRIPRRRTSDFFDFMDQAFPGAKFVLNSRDHDDVVTSGFWQQGTEDEARAAISRIEEIQAFLRESRPGRTFDTNYETLTGDDEQARDAMLRGLATFVGGSCDEALLASLRKTLSVGHGPNPFGASRASDTADEAAAREEG